MTLIVAIALVVTFTVRWVYLAYRMESERTVWTETYSQPNGETVTTCSRHKAWYDNWLIANGYDNPTKL